MSSLHEPIVNSWYLNHRGKLMKVRLLLFTGVRLSRVMVEYLDGSRYVIDARLWSYLDLDTHTDRSTLPDTAKDL